MTITNNLEDFLATNYPDPVLQYRILFESLYNVCNKNNWGDPFSYARSREIHMAGILGHRVADTYSGADAISDLGEVEYKSTIAKTINATYNGISVQPTWEDQDRYLKEEKICKYKKHYYSRYEHGIIKEIWEVDGDVVYSLIVDKLKQQYFTVKNKKDPRLGINISGNIIKKYGTKVYPV